MNSTLQREIDFLKTLFTKIGETFSPQSGATAAEIAAVEERTGIAFDEDFKAFWQFSNDSGYQDWFAEDDIDPDNQH